MPAALLSDLDHLDPEAMKALIGTQHEQLSSRASEIAHLKLLLDKLQRMLFGARSEKLVRQVAQLELQLEELETSRGEEEGSSHLPFPIETEREPKQSSRRTLPEHLPREIETHRPETSCCPDGGGALREFGEDVSEVLEYVPESFKVIRHMRPKFNCGRCETVVEATAPSRPIPRSYAGPGLLAHVLVAKYCDHTPLNRQSEIYARDGVDLDRSTFAAGSALRPLCSRPWSKRCALMCSQPPGFMPTIPPCRYSRRATEERRPEGYGPMSAMAAHVAMLFRLRSGSPSRRPPRRTPADPLEELPRNPPGRRLCRFSSTL